MVGLCPNRTGRIVTGPFLNFAEARRHEQAVRFVAELEIPRVSRSDDRFSECHGFRNVETKTFGAMSGDEAVSELLERSHLIGWHQKVEEQDVGSGILAPHRGNLCGVTVAGMKLHDQKRGRVVLECLGERFEYGYRILSLKGA